MVVSVNEQVQWILARRVSPSCFLTASSTRHPSRAYSCSFLNPSPFPQVHIHTHTHFSRCRVRRSVFRRQRNFPLQIPSKPRQSTRSSFVGKRNITSLTSSNERLLQLHLSASTQILLKGSVSFEIKKQLSLNLVNYTETRST